MIYIKSWNQNTIGKISSEICNGPLPLYSCYSSNKCDNPSQVPKVVLHTALPMWLELQDFQSLVCGPWNYVSKQTLSRLPSATYPLLIMAFLAPQIEKADLITTIMRNVYKSLFFMVSSTCGKISTNMRSHWAIVLNTITLVYNLCLTKAHSQFTILCISI